MILKLINIKYHAKFGIEPLSFRLNDDTWVSVTVLANSKPATGQYKYIRTRNGVMGCPIEMYVRYYF